MTNESRRRSEGRIRFRSCKSIAAKAKEIWKSNFIYYVIVVLVFASWFLAFQPMYIVTSKIGNDEHLISFTVTELMEFGGAKYAYEFVMVLFLATVVISLIPFFVDCEIKAVYLVPCIITSIIIVAFLLYLVTHVTGLKNAVNELKFLPFEISRTPYLIALTVTAELTVVSGIYVD